MIIDRDVTAEVKVSLVGAAYLLKNATVGWLPEVGACFNVTFTVAQRDAVLAAIRPPAPTAGQ